MFAALYVSMKNRYAFVLGVLFTISAYIIYYEYTYGGKVSYDYHPESRDILIEVLEEKGILYSYKIDHLKRHWVTPMTRDSETLKSIEHQVNQRLGRKK